MSSTLWPIAALIKITSLILSPFCPLYWTCRACDPTASFSHMNTSSVLKSVYSVNKVFLLINCYSTNMLDISIMSYEHVISSLVCFLGGHFTNLNFFTQIKHHCRIYAMYFLSQSIVKFGPTWASSCTSITQNLRSNVYGWWLLFCLRTFLFFQLMTLCTFSIFLIKSASSIISSFYGLGDPKHLCCKQYN
jgi:hypothetical protein